jgi:DNA polymerase III, alpha subunit
MMEFVPLQVLSSYSLLNSTTKIDQLVSAAKQRGYRSLALTDEDVLYGAVEFYNAARQADIHPIIGLTLRMNSVAEEGVTVPVVLLAKDWQGYQNLMKLSTLQNTGDEKTRLTYSQVKPMLAHVFVIHPTNGDAYRLVQQGNSDQARDLLVQWQSDADEQSVFDRCESIYGSHFYGNRFINWLMQLIPRKLR